MNMNRIVIKLGGSIILLFLIVLLPLGFVLNQMFTGFYYNKVQEDIDELSSRYAETITSSGSPAMAVSMIEMMSQFSETKLYIVDSEGKVVANSGVPWNPKDSTIAKEEVELLAVGKTIRKTIESPTTQDRFLVTGTPMISGNEVIGGVYVLSSIEAIYQSIQRVRQLLILSGIGAFFLAVGFTFVLSKKLVAPLIQMERATRQIAKGELNTRVHIPAGDEIGTLAAAINDLAQDLQRYRDTRREFFANISHELRTPMTYLEGYATVLKSKMYETEEEKEKYLDIISQESKRLTHLIHDLFELSKIEEGKVSLEMDWLDVSEVVETTAQKVSLKAKEKGLTVEKDFQEPLPLIYADPFRMEQVVMNLLDNAIRYTEQGKIVVRLSHSPSSVHLNIEDTGIGIPEEDLPYIFDRLYRVEKSRSREHGGTGLGLAIVKKLVDMQGGTIEVTSRVGKGTKFVITFPGGEDR
jgi:signal transduction histidine kinase